MNAVPQHPPPQLDPASSVSPEQARAPGRHRWRRARLVAITLVVLALLGWWLGHHWLLQRSRAATVSRAGTPPVPVVAGQATIKDVPIYLDGLGTVQAFNTVAVHTRVDGQLVKVTFTEGQDVKAGDVLAQIDPAPYQAAYDQALARKAQDVAQLANARLDGQRYVELLKTDSITRQVYDTQQALLAQLEATVKADQAAIEAARVNLDYTTIQSPIDGRAGIRQVDQGNIVHANDANALVVLTQLRPISVLFTLPEQALARLRSAPSHNPFVVLALGPDNTNVAATGTLTVVDNQIDTTTGTIRLKATFPNEDLQLWPGQFVNVRLHLATRTNAVVVPASVVQRGPDGTFAFIITDDNTAAMRPVDVFQIESGVALIDAGLKPGERVVVDGQYKLLPGSRVKLSEPPQEKRKAESGKPGPSPSPIGWERAGLRARVHTQVEATHETADGPPHPGPLLPPREERETLLLGSWSQ